MRYIVLCLPMLLAGCDFGKGVSLKGNTLYFYDEITPQTVQFAQSLIGRSNKPISTIMMDSKGGDYKAAMDLGRWVHTNEVHLIIDGDCQAECASYVLPAASSVLVTGGSSVLWVEPHKFESLKSPSDKEAIERWNRTMLLLRNRESTFYSMVSVNPKISLFGYLNNQEKWQKQGCSMDMKGWHYDIDSLNKLGVKNITYVDLNREQSDDVCFLNISDSDLKSVIKL
ncbi:hypothetical protein ACPV4A_04320 [Vibrio rotiferianus]|uniref:hypothetical protein n=1 Tax=Vibrio rotiferianus TaxID=190895 RepID=UPI00406A805E